MNNAYTFSQYFKQLHVCATWTHKKIDKSCF